MSVHDSKVIPLNSLASESDRETLHLLVDKTCSITLRYLSTLLKRMLDNADDTLFSLADKAENNLLQSNYFDAMREIRKKRDFIEKNFGQYIEARFKDFVNLKNHSASTHSKSTDTINMSLIDESDLEESLAVSSAAEKVNNRLARELYAIEQRFSALNQNRTVQMEELPLSPKAICEIFRDSIKDLNVDTSIKLIIYKLYEKYVTSNLPPLYEEVNLLFIEANILPHLKMTIKPLSHAKRGQRPHLSESNREDYFIDTSSPTSESLDNGAGYNYRNDGEIIRTLQNLMKNGSRAVTENNIINNTSSPYIDPIDIVNALSSIQTRIANSESFESIEQLKDALSSEIKTSISDGKIDLVSTIDNDIIDIVSMIFDFILDDKNLSSVAKALLSRLQIPILKIAISDNEFFSKKQHPARLLLNKMAQAAVGINDDVRLNNSPLLQKIEYIVNRIINNFDNNIVLFDDLIEEFDRFYNISIAQEKRAQDESRKIFESREKDKLTSKWVMESIYSRIRNRKIPGPAYEIISGPWLKVMTNTYLNNSEDSTLWKEQLRFVDLLIWSVEPKNSDQDKKRLANILIELLITLQDGLKSINIDKKDMDDLLSRLEKCHMASMRGEHSHAPENKPQTKHNSGSILEPDDINEIDAALTEIQTQLNDMNKLEEMLNTPILNIEDEVIAGFDDIDKSIENIVITTTAPHENIEPLIDDEFWQRVQDLKAGQWLNIKNQDSKNQHLRLVWKSDYLGECSFTNWKFKVVAEFSFNELASLFRSGQASLIENLPLFERAIDTIMNTLHQRVSAHS